MGPTTQCLSQTQPFTDFTDLTLADTNSILTDNANREIQGNVAMEITQPVGQICF